MRRQRERDRALERAVKRAGTKRELARELGVHPSTIRRWEDDGVSDEGAKRLATLNTQRGEERERGRIERAQFLEFMKVSGELGMLPEIRSSEGTRAGSKTSGRYWTRRIGLMKGPAAVAAIERAFAQVRRSFPLWQAVLTVSMYTKSKHKGYKTIYHQFKEAPDASGDFAIQSEFTTSRTTSLAEARDSILSQLESQEGLVFVHAITIYNYRMRSEEERRAWNTQERRKRARALESRKPRRKKEKKKWPKKPKGSKQKEQKTSRSESSASRSTKTRSSQSSRSRSKTPKVSRKSKSVRRSNMRDFPTTSKKQKFSSKSSNPTKATTKARQTTVRRTKTKKSSRRSSKR